MAKSVKSTVANLAALETQIAALQAKADNLRKAKERAVAGVHALMRKGGLTIADIQLGNSTPDAEAPAAAKKVSAKAAAEKSFLPHEKNVAAAPAKLPKSTSKVKPKYRDPATGDTWAGRGGKPKWFREGLAAGKTPEDFLIAKPAAKKAVAKKLPRGAKMVSKDSSAKVAKAAAKKAPKKVAAKKVAAKSASAKPAATKRVAAKKAAKAPVKAAKKAGVKRAAPAKVAAPAASPTPEAAVS
jgi:DNA-binding protein H-NS